MLFLCCCCSFQFPFLVSSSSSPLKLLSIFSPTSFILLLLQEPTGRLSSSARRWVSSVVGPEAAARIRTTKELILAEGVDRITAEIWRGVEGANGKANNQV